MAKIRNVSGQDLLVPWLGNRLVFAGQVVDVEDAHPYTVQASTWAPADDDARSQTFPARNASRDEWAAFVVSTGRATEDELDGMGRDQIRDTYSTKG